MEHIIWSNMDINVEDYADFLREEYPEVTDPDKQYELCCEMNANYLDDERANLDKVKLPNGMTPDDYTDAMLRRQIADNPPEDETEEDEG